LHLHLLTYIQHGLLAVEHLYLAADHSIRADNIR
jgi:hypothetical protein